MGKLSVVLSLIVCLVGCNSQKAPAEAAFAQVQASVAAISTDLEKYAPEEYVQLSASIDDMKSKLNTKDYAGALAQRAQVMAQLTAVSGAAGKRKNLLQKQLGGQWKELATTVPALLTQLNSRVDALQGAAKLPTEVSAEAFQQAKRAVSDLNAEWLAAQNAMRAREADVAVSKAKEISKRAAEVSTMLGIKTAA